MQMTNEKKAKKAKGGFFIMKNNTYKIIFNFSDKVYIGTTTQIITRKAAHESRFSRVFNIIKTDQRPLSEINSDSPNSSEFSTQHGIPLKMYIDALCFYRKTGIEPKVEKIKCINTFYCDCMSHIGTPCKKALGFERNYQLKIENYNQRPPRVCI